MTTESQRIDNKSEWLTSLEKRKERADYYFQTVLENQRNWYSAKASGQKKRHLFFAISVILFGAAITFLQVLDAAAWVKYTTAALGAATSALRALDVLLHPGETWQAYRKASENMKREQRLYINNADVYKDTQDEDSAYRLLVERIEAVLAEEQQLYWQSHAKNPDLQQDIVQDKDQG